MSFTYLHWKVAEALGNENVKFRVSSMDEKYVKALILNVFPQGKTVLHYINDNSAEIKSLYTRVNEINSEIKDKNV
jgi:hypothetical protein